MTAGTQRAGMLSAEQPGTASLSNAAQADVMDATKYHPKFPNDYYIRPEFQVKSPEVNMGGEDYSNRRRTESGFEEKPRAEHTQDYSSVTAAASTYDRKFALFDSPTTSTGIMGGRADMSGSVYDMRSGGANPGFFR